MTSSRPISRFFHPVLPAARLRKKPVRVEVDGEGYALFRDGSGRPAALLDRCPHRFSPLSKGKVRPDGRLACPYHGWHFDAQGQGSSPSHATAAHCEVESFQVVERYGTLWLGGRDAHPEALPLQTPEGYHYAGSFSRLMPAPLHVALDNFSEDEHTPYVHTRLGWDEAGTDTIEFTAENFDDRSTVHYQARQRWMPILRLFGLQPGDLFHNEWVTRFDPVRTEYSIYWTDPTGQVRRPLLTRSTIFMVPETEKTCRFHVFVFSRSESPFYQRFIGPFSQLARLLGMIEVRDDAQFLPTVADCTPRELTGMKLGKYDKPVIHNRKLLRSLYYGEPARPALAPVRAQP